VAVPVGMAALLKEVAEKNQQKVAAAVVAWRQC